MYLIACVNSRTLRSIFRAYRMCFHMIKLISTVNPLYKDIRYNSKICYNVNLVCTKISGLCIFSLIFLFYSSGKDTFCVFVRIASGGDSNKYTKRMIYEKKCSKVSVINALDGSLSSFFITANSILQQNLW